MLITIPDLVPERIADKIVADISGLDWHAGDTTDEAYRQVKQNQELKEDDSPIAQKHLVSIMRATMSNPGLRNKVFPYKLKTPQFNRYSGGGAYHRHSDMALIGRPEIRTDLSITVFLSAPGDYDGGELTLEYPSGEVRKVKEKKGALVCYPSEVLHYVTPVTRGTRYAAVTWVQSYIRAQAQRNVLTELLALSHRVREAEGVSDTYTRLFSIHSNLFRMWAEF